MQKGENPYGIEKFWDAYTAQVPEVKPEVKVKTCLTELLYSFQTDSMDRAGVTLKTTFCRSTVKSKEV